MMRGRIPDTLFQQITQDVSGNFSGDGASGGGSGVLDHFFCSGFA